MSTELKRKIEEEEIVEEPAKKIVKKSRKVIRPGFGDEKYSETEYYFENGKFLFIYLFKILFKIDIQVFGNILNQNLCIVSYNTCSF